MRKNDYIKSFGNKKRIRTLGKRITHAALHWIPVFGLLGVVSVWSMSCKDKSSSEETKEKKSGAAEKTQKLELVTTEIPSLGITMQAPKGAEISGDKQVSIRKDDAFSVSIGKDIFGAKGDSLIIPFEKKRMKKKLVDEETLQIWTKDMGGETVVLFAMTIKTGDKRFYVQSGPMGMFTRPQVDLMIKAVKTIKPKKGATKKGAGG